MVRRDNSGVRRDVKDLGSTSRGVDGSVWHGTKLWVAGCSMDLATPGPRDIAKGPSS